jgi:hypothetical protein
LPPQSLDADLEKKALARAVGYRAPTLVQAHPSRLLKKPVAYVAVRPARPRLGSSCLYVHLNAVAAGGRVSAKAQTLAVSRPPPAASAIGRDCRPLQRR